MAKMPNMMEYTSKDDLPNRSAAASWHLGEWSWWHVVSVSVTRRSAESSAGLTLPILRKLSGKSTAAELWSHNDVTRSQKMVADDNVYAARGAA